MTRRIKESDRTKMTASAIADSLYGLQVTHKKQGHKFNPRFILDFDLAKKMKNNYFVIEYPLSLIRTHTQKYTQ